MHSGFIPQCFYSIQREGTIDSWNVIYSSVFWNCMAKQKPNGNGIQTREIGEWDKDVWMMIWPNLIETLHL